MRVEGAYASHSGVFRTGPSSHRWAGGGSDGVGAGTVVDEAAAVESLQVDAELRVLLPQFVQARRAGLDDLRGKVKATLSAKFAALNRPPHWPKARPYEESERLWDAAMANAPCFYGMTTPVEPSLFDRVNVAAIVIPQWLGSRASANPPGETAKEPSPPPPPPAGPPRNEETVVARKETLNVVRDANHAERKREQEPTPARPDYATSSRSAAVAPATGKDRAAAVASPFDRDSLSLRVKSPPVFSRPPSLSSAATQTLSPRMRTVATMTDPVTVLPASHDCKMEVEKTQRHASQPRGLYQSLMSNGQNHKPDSYGKKRELAAESEESDEEQRPTKKNAFITAYDKLQRENASKRGNQAPRAGLSAQASGGGGGGGGGSSSSSNSSTGVSNGSVGAGGFRKPIGLARPSKFVSPLLSNSSRKEEEADATAAKPPADPKKAAVDELMADDRLRNVDARMVEAILNEIMDHGQPIEWDDIAGLEHAKTTIKEVVVWPMMRPDIFTGLRGPPKGLLLFGPPGTGKTMIGKCIASQSGATFFSISSSSLTSKWVGDGEKMVRALFAVARVRQPSVIFLDEIDSLLTQRTDGEVEASRRIKTEFLVQFDGCGTSSEDRILLIGATNRPHEIDEAARRRFRKKLYIPLPEPEARRRMLVNLLAKQSHCIEADEIDTIIEKTEGYSGSDMDGLIREAALGPIRDIRDIRNISADDVRPVALHDFELALTQVRASVSEKDLDLYLRFDAEYGSVSQPSAAAAAAAAGVGGGGGAGRGGGGRMDTGP